MLYHVYGEGTMSITQILCGLSNFKTEGKMLQNLKDLTIRTHADVYKVTMVIKLTLFGRAEDTNMHRETARLNRQRLCL
jgi:hypothetical protein